MPFEPGHPPYPPKDGTKLLGRSPGDRRAIRDLTRAVRDRVDPLALVELHQAVAAGHNARLAVGVQPKRGWRFVTWDDHDREGVTLQARLYAAKWLSERGWGLPVQQIQLDGEMRRVGAGDTAVALPAGMTLDKLRTLREALRPAGSTPGAEPQGLIPATADATADATDPTDELGENADADQPARETTPASVIDAEAVELPAR